MKRIKYMYLAWEQNDGTEVKQHFNPKDIPYSEETLDVAKREAYNGEYEIYEDGQPEPVTPETGDVRWDTMAEAIKEGVNEV